jgi:5-formyltetrahydrofolate cyclo-ligase
VVLPRVVWHPRRLDLYAITDPAWDLEPGPWGIPQPMPGRCQETMPRDLDFVFTPGVAFDLEGNRLGYGGGFYDSLLSQVRRELRGEGVAGLAFELQLVPEVPHKPKDMPVPLIITEERTIETAAHIPTSRGL